jgi:hypothetical protein
MATPQEVVFVNGFGLMRVPAGLSDKDLDSYVSQELSKPQAPTPVEEKPKPSPGIMSQLGAGAVGTLEGLGTSVGSMIKGLSYIDPANIGYKYLTGDKVGPTEKIGDFISDSSKELSAKALGDELYNSTGASAGRFTGTLGSYFLPGGVAKVLGAGAKAALAASTLASAAGGAGEQSQSIREARKEGKDISAGEEYALVGAAGAGTALLERIPLARFLEAGAAAPFLKRIPGIGKLLDSAIPVETVKQIEKKFAGDGAKIAEALALAGVQASATRSIKDIAIDAAKSGLLEAPVEGLQNTLQNALTKTYNPDQAIAEGLMGSMVGGAVAGTALKGGIGLFESNRSRNIIRQNQAEAQRTRGPAPVIPTVLPQDTLVSSNTEQRFVGRESAESRDKRLNQEAEAAAIDEKAKEILAQGQPATPLLPPGGKFTQVDTRVGPISIGSDENIEDAILRIEKSREESRQSNEAVRQSLVGAKANEIISGGETDTRLLPAPTPESLVEYDDLDLGRVSFSGNLSPEQIAQQLEQAKLLRADMERSNDSAKFAYEQAETAKKTRSIKDVKSVISDYPDIGKSTLSNLGYDSVEAIPIGDVPSFIDLVTEGIYNRQQTIELSNKNITDNLGIASDLARSEFRRPISSLSQDKKIELSGLVDTQLGLNREEYQGAQEDADIKTAINVERSSKEPIRDTRKRTAVSLFNTPLEQTSDSERLAVEAAVKDRSDASLVVTPEEILERRQFEDKPFTTEKYREVQGKLKESPDISITATRLRKDFDLSAPEAGSMLSLMKQRGDATDLGGKLFIEDSAKGPMFDLNETQPTPEPQVSQTQSQPQPQAVKPEPIDPAQFEFNEDIAKQYAPDLVAALKDRKMDDVLLLGIAGAIRDANGNVRPSRGQYLDRLITISVAPDGKVRSTKDMIKTLDHEIIHAMKELNMFSENEWNMLTKKFQVSYLGDREQQYRKLYEGRKDLAPLLREEAVAKAASDSFDVDPKRLDPVSRSLVSKVKSILGFGRTAAQMGYASAEDVLAAIKSGEVGSRAYAPAFEVTTQGKEVSRQRPVSIGAPKKIETLITPIAPGPSTATAVPAVVDPNAEPETKKKKRKKKPRPAGTPEIMTDLGNEVSEVESEDKGDNLTPGGLSRVFTPPAKQGLLDRIANLFSYDRQSSFRQKLLDQYDPVRIQALKAYAKTQDPSYISAGGGAYQALLMSDKAQDIAMSALANGGLSTTASGRIQANDDPDNSMLQMFQDLSSTPASQPGFANKLEEWAEVAAARHFMALTKAGRNPGGVVSEQQIQKTLDTYAGDSVIDKALAKYKSFNEQVVDALVDSKFISKEMGETWKSSAYIPMYRIPTVRASDGSNVETGEVDAPQVGKKSTNLAAIKSLTGRNLRVNDFLENIVYNVNNMVGTAMKNHAAQKVVRDGLITENMKQIDAPKDAEYRTNVITIRNNGAKEYYQVNDSMLYDAVAKSGIPLQDVLGFMGKFTQLLRRGVTASPTFIFRNSVRDVLDVWSRGGLGSDLIPPIGDYIKGVVSVAQNSPDYRALKQAGVAGSGIRQGSVKDTAKAIREKIGAGQDDTTSKLLSLVTKSFGKLEKFSEASEGVARTQVYKKVLEETGDVDEAVFSAMETINFSRRGNSRGAQVAMALIPFFNARLQGLDIFYRTLKGDKLAESSIGSDARTTAKRRMAYAAGLSALYTVAMATNKAWLNANDEERRNNIFIPIDWISGIKEGTVLKFPIPQESGIITKMLPESLISYYLGQADGPAMVSAMQSVVLGTLSFDPTPQVFRPYLESAANFDFYTQRPIENISMQRINPGQRYTEYTPEAYKAAGKAFGVSPIKLEHLVRGYFGAVGAMTADVGSMIFTGGGKESPDRLRFSEPYLLPVVGQMFKSPNGSRAVESLYMLDQAASMASATLRLASKGQREFSDEEREQLRAMSVIDKRLQPIINQVQALNKMKRTILASTGTASEKRDRLNDIQERIIAAADRAKDLKKLVP